MRVHLNGGPWHDRHVEVRDGAGHIHVLQPVQMAVDELLTSATPLEDIALKRREGMYSKCVGYPGEFEWDGWVSHD